MLWRHRLLHMRGSLKRKWSKPRRHLMNIGLSLASKLCHCDRANSWPSIWEDWRQRDHHIAHNLRKRCIKRNVEGIHGSDSRSFLEISLISWISIRTEEACIQMDKDSQKDFTYHMTQEEYFWHRKNRWISLNNSGRSGSLKDRSDFNDALTTLSRLHQESGKNIRLFPFWKYKQWHSSSSSFSSWWEWNDSRWSSWQLTRKSTTELMWRATW